MKRTKGELISQEDSRRDTSISSSSTPHPTFCGNEIFEAESQHLDAIAKSAVSLRIPFDVKIRMTGWIAYSRLNSS